MKAISYDVHTLKKESVTLSHVHVKSLNTYALNIVYYIRIDIQIT